MVNISVCLGVEKTFLITTESHIPLRERSRDLTFKTSTHGGRMTSDQGMGAGGHRP